MQAVLGLEPVVDQLPGARRVLADLALAALGASARPVQELLGAAGDRANASGQAEDAGAAGGTALLPDSLLGRHTHEGCVEAGDDDSLREALGHRLHAHAAAQG